MSSSFSILAEKALHVIRRVLSFVEHMNEIRMYESIDINVIHGPRSLTCPQKRREEENALPKYADNTKTYVLHFFFHACSIGALLKSTLL
jgi:hypothetical protein